MKSRPSCVKVASCPKLHFSAPGKSDTPAPSQLPSRKASGTRSGWRSEGISIMGSDDPSLGGRGRRGRERSALALVELLPGQPDETEAGHDDQDQQGGEDCLKHELLLVKDDGPDPSLVAAPGRRSGGRLRAVRRGGILGCTAWR